jgi:hypothetical protein
MESTLDADAVIFATGYAYICFILVQRWAMVGAHFKLIWGLDVEGEIRDAWCDVGIPPVWFSGS